MHPISRYRGLQATHDLPEHLLVETQIESDTLCTTFFIRGSNCGEFAIPRLAATIPTGNLKMTFTHSIAVCLVLFIVPTEDAVKKTVLTSSPVSGLITLL